MFQYQILFKHTNENLDFVYKNMFSLTLKLDMTTIGTQLLAPRAD